MLPPLRGQDGCEVWGFCKADSFERFVISFFKSVLCVKQSTPNSFVYGELGIFPLIIERKVRIVKYWIKILNSNDACFLRKIYNELLLISESFPSQVTWVTLLRDMLFQYGFGYVWVEQSVTREFLSLFEQRVKDNYLQEWDAQVRSTSDFRLFKKIKYNFEF